MNNKMERREFVRLSLASGVGLSVMGVSDLLGGETPDYPAGFSPWDGLGYGMAQAYQSDYERDHLQMMMGLAAAGGFLTASIGAFFTTSALQAGTAVESSVVVNGTTYFGVSVDQATALEAAAAGDAGAAQALLEAAGMTEEQILAIHTQLQMQALEQEAAQTYRGAMICFFTSGL